MCMKENGMKEKDKDMVFVPNKMAAQAKASGLTTNFMVNVI